MYLTIAVPVIVWTLSFSVLNVVVKSLSSSLGGLTATAQIEAMLRSPSLYAAGLLYGCCALLYFFLLGRLPLSVAGPMFMVLGIVITTAIGSLVFGESLGPQKTVGMLVCMLGMGLIYGSAQS